VKPMKENTFFRLSEDQNNSMSDFATVLLVLQFFWKFLMVFLNLFSIISIIQQFYNFSTTQTLRNPVNITSNHQLTLTNPFQNIGELDRSEAVLRARAIVAYHTGHFR
jgi:hypothetical protein